jgi:hypothetical protein
LINNKNKKYWNTLGKIEMKKIFMLTIIIFTVSLISCNSVEPPDDNLQPGRRDYVWTVDTLDYNNYLRIWASSPTNVWCTSPGYWDKSIAHFNGEMWSSYGVTGMNTPHSIFGFSDNNIYIGTAGGGIWRFEGSSWKLFAELTKDGHNDVVFDNIWGESSNDFFAFGAYPDENGYANNSVIAHFYNGGWEMLNTNGLYGIVEHLFKNYKDNKIYLQVIGGREFTDSTHIYEYSQGKYYKLYGNVWTQGLQADISLINGEVYFVLGSEIAKRVNNQFQTILQIDNPNFYQRIWGRNSKDIFLMMVDGLAHYNGTNIEYLFTYPLRTQVFGAALFDKEVIFLVYESSTNLNLIYHGKLN